VQNFEQQKIWDVTLSEATLHIGETERGAKEKEIRYGFGADGAFREFDTACNARVCLTILQEFLNIDTKN
jgi:kynurenine 3-monooxygenase